MKFKVGDTVKDEYDNIGRIEMIFKDKWIYVYFDIDSDGFFKEGDLTLIEPEQENKKTIKEKIYFSKATKQLFTGCLIDDVEDMDNFVFIKEIEVELPEEKKETLSDKMYYCDKGWIINEL